MSSSKDLPPSTTPFFPNQFIKNQFGSTPRYPPKDTDLTGQVAIVTGSNTGLGLECSKQLLSYKLSRLIMAVRSPEKGNAAAAQLRENHPEAAIEVWVLDMASYDSVRAFANRVERELIRLDVAILNAGLAFKTQFTTVSATGHEETVQVNYLSTMLLTVLLLPVLKSKSPPDVPGRLTISTSMLSTNAKFSNQKEVPLLPSFDDKDFYDSRDIYATSKLLGQMFIWKLTDLVSANDVVVNMVEPGFVKGTDLQRDLPAVAKLAIALFKAAAARTVQVGVATYLDAAVVKGKESHGCILMNWEIIPYVPLQYTQEGKDIMQRLWQETVDEFSFIDVTDILQKL